MSLRTLLTLCALILCTTLTYAETNTTQPHRIELVLTVSGMKESTEAIRQSAEAIATLTRHLSDKKEFSTEDHRLVTALTTALNRNAEAIEQVTETLPQQMHALQNGTSELLAQAAGSAREVVTASKTELIDPTLERIQTQLLLFVAAFGIILIGVVWFALWQIRGIVSTASETIGNIAQTVRSVENVVDKVNRSEEQWSSY